MSIVNRNCFYFCFLLSSRLHWIRFKWLFLIDWFHVLNSYLFPGQENCPSNATFDRLYCTTECYNSSVSLLLLSLSLSLSISFIFLHSAPNNRFSSCFISQIFLCILYLLICTTSNCSSCISVRCSFHSFCQQNKQFDLSLI